jgi:hypothetical protein
MLGTAGAAGTAGIPQGFVFGPPSGAVLGGLGYWLGGLDGVVSDFSATAVAALGGEDGVPATGFGAVEGEAGGGREAAGPGAVDDVLGVHGLGAVEGVGAAGATDVAGLGAIDVPAAGAIEPAGFGAGMDAPAAPGARAGSAEIPAARGFEKSGGAGIEVSPVAGPGPSGAAG